MRDCASIAGIDSLPQLSTWWPRGVILEHRWAFLMASARGVLVLAMGLARARADRPLPQRLQPASW